MKFIWNQPVGLPECPYLNRWVADFGLFSIRLHHWLDDDDWRHEHDHPWWFLTFVLSGFYIDYSGETADVVNRWHFRFRSADHRHSVQGVLPNTWTLLITGPAKRRWGFWVDDKLIKRDKYFATYGHHPCDQYTSTKPVRMKPDGTRIGE